MSRRHLLYAIDEHRPWAAAPLGTPVAALSQTTSSGRWPIGRSLIRDSRTSHGLPPTACRTAGRRARPATGITTTRRVSGATCSHDIRNAKMKWKTRGAKGTAIGWRLQGIADVEKARGWCLLGYSAA